MVRSGKDKFNFNYWEWQGKLEVHFRYVIDIINFRRHLRTEHVHVHTLSLGWLRAAETGSVLSAFWTQVSNQRISCGSLCQNPHSNPSHFVHTVAPAPLKRLSVCMKERKKKESSHRQTEREGERDPAGKCDFLQSWVALLKPIRFTMTNLTFLQCCHHKRPLFLLLLKTLQLRLILC